MRKSLKFLEKTIFTPVQIVVVVVFYFFFFLLFFYSVFVSVFFFFKKKPQKCDSDLAKEILATDL